MNKILATLFLILTLAGCATSAPQRVHKSTQIDLTQYIGHDEKEVVALITSKSGAPRQYSPVESGSCYAWTRYQGSYNLAIWFKGGVLHSFANGQACPAATGSGKKGVFDIKP